MESTNSNGIKIRFREFSQKNGFIYHNSDPLEAPKDSRLLFNISGGVKYQSELLGLKDATEKRVSSIQNCLRTDGMNAVGYSGRHHLFFEMLGHFMFYCANEKECKEEFIKFAYDFLIKEVGLDKERLFVTVHPQDKCSLDIWSKMKNKNIILSTKNIFLSPYADKSALRTEIKWQRPDKEESLVELWNLVFTQFDSKELFRNPSALIAADSGASLERIVSAYENISNNYENSMWIEFVEFIKSLSQIGSDEDYRRIADFFNTSVQMINEGILPGNKVQPYMLRKILRTLFDICDELEINYEDIINEYLKYNNLLIDRNSLIKILKEEQAKYYKTIQNGLLQVQKCIRKNDVDKIDYQYLKSTCGLPVRYINQILSDKENIVKRLKHS